MLQQNCLCSLSQPLSLASNTSFLFRENIYAHLFGIIQDISFGPQAREVMEVQELLSLTNIKLERDSDLQKVTEHWQRAEQTLGSRSSDVCPVLGHL